MLKANPPCPGGATGPPWFAVKLKAPEELPVDPSEPPPPKALLLFPTAEKLKAPGLGVIEALPNVGVALLLLLFGCCPNGELLPPCDVKLNFGGSWLPWEPCDPGYAGGEEAPPKAKGLLLSGAGADDCPKVNGALVALLLLLLLVLLAPKLNELF